LCPPDVDGSCAADAAGRALVTRTRRGGLCGQQFCRFGTAGGRACSGRHGDPPALLVPACDHSWHMATKHDILMQMARMMAYKPTHRSYMVAVAHTPQL